MLRQEKSNESFLQYPLTLPLKTRPLAWKVHGAEMSPAEGAMTGKRHTEEQIIAVFKDAQAGLGSPELCRTSAGSGCVGTTVMNSPGRPWMPGPPSTVCTCTLFSPEKPVQNACIESFDGTFRDECLNEYWLWL
jgi:hypothetical protein